jgi:hypothetical protein
MGHTPDGITLLEALEVRGDDIARCCHLIIILEIGFEHPEVAEVQLSLVMCWEHPELIARLLVLGDLPTQRGITVGTYVTTTIECDLGAP